MSLAFGDLEQKACVHLLFPFLTKKTYSHFLLAFVFLTKKKKKNPHLDFPVATCRSLVDSPVGPALPVPDHGSVCLVPPPPPPRPGPSQSQQLLRAAASVKPRGLPGRRGRSAHQPPRTACFTPPSSLPCTSPHAGTRLPPLPTNTASREPLVTDHKRPSTSSPVKA